MASSMFPWSWKILFCVIFAVLLILAAGLKYAALQEESAVRRCHAHLHEIAFAVSFYNEKYGHLPPTVVYEDGVAMHSWRVLILEFWRPELFARYRMDEPWNSPHNSKLASQMPHQYACDFSSDQSSGNETGYVAVVGENTVMSSSDQGVRRQSDAASDAIMLIELPNRLWHWMSPEHVSAKQVTSYFDLSAGGLSRHGHYVTSDVRVRPVCELSQEALAHRLQRE